MKRSKSLDVVLFRGVSENELPLRKTNGQWGIGLYVVEMRHYADSYAHIHRNKKGGRAVTYVIKIRSPKILDMTDSAKPPLDECKDAKEYLQSMKRYIERAKKENYDMIRGDQGIYMLFELEKAKILKRFIHGEPNYNCIDCNHKKAKY